MSANAGNVRCTKLLLDMGAKMMVKDKSGYTAMGYCEKNVKFKNRREKACSKILEIFRDVYEKRKEAYEKFKEEEESVLQAQNDARDEQQLDYDDNSNDDEGDSSEGEQDESDEAMGDSDGDEYQSYYDTY